MENTDPADEWDADDLPLTFRREQPPRSRLLGTVLALSGMVLGMAVFVVGAVLLEISGSLPLVPTELLLLPGGRTAAGGSLIGVGLLLFVLPWLHGVARQRRYGSCTVHPDGLRLRRGEHEDTVLLSSLDERSITRHGVLLTVRGESRVWAWLQPVFLPTSDEATSARLLRLLDRLSPRPDQLEEVVIPRANVRLRALIWFLVFAPMALFVAWSLPQVGWRGLLFWPQLIISTLGGSALELASQPWLMRLRFLRASLIFGYWRVDRLDVTGVALVGRYLAVTTSRGGVVACVSDLDRLREGLRLCGLPGEPASELPEWARGPARRRRLVTAALVWAVANGVAAALALWASGRWAPR